MLNLLASTYLVVTLGLGYDVDQGNKYNELGDEYRLHGRASVYAVTPLDTDFAIKYGYEHTSSLENGLEGNVTDNDQLFLDAVWVFGR